jgi:hypothetical protein
MLALQCIDATLPEPLLALRGGVQTMNRINSVHASVRQLLRLGLAAFLISGCMAMVQHLFVALALGAGLACGGRLDSAIEMQAGVTPRPFRIAS